jgi:hypothetical protein
MDAQTVDSLIAISVFLFLTSMTGYHLWYYDWDELSYEQKKFYRAVRFVFVIAFVMLIGSLVKAFA